MRWHHQNKWSWCLRRVQAEFVRKTWTEGVWEDAELKEKCANFHRRQKLYSAVSQSQAPPSVKTALGENNNTMRKPEEKKVPQSKGRSYRTCPDNSRNISVWTKRGGVAGGEMVEQIGFFWRKKKKKRTWKEGTSERRRREMPPDRRSSGKQKRLHTLLRLICLRVLSTTGSVSVTPFPPCRPLCLHLIPPHLQSHPPAAYTHPLLLLCRGPRYQGQGWRQGGPLVLGGPETEADSAAEAASTLAVGTTDPAHLDPVALHVHRRNTRRGEDARVIHESTHTSAEPGDSTVENVHIVVKAEIIFFFFFNYTYYLKNGCWRWLLLDQQEQN